MPRCIHLFRIALPLPLLLLPLLTSQAFGADPTGTTGWEADSEYNSYYNAKELDRIKGVITKFVEITPLPGMAPGTALYLDEGDGEKYWSMSVRQHTPNRARQGCARALKPRSGEAGPISTTRMYFSPPRSSKASISRSR